MRTTLFHSVHNQCLEKAKLNTNTLAGIDVSRYQGQVDWHKVRDSGIRFAFMKATEGATHSDNMFKRNWSEAKANDIIRGAYHYFRVNASLEEQQENFVRTLENLEVGDLPPVLDVEEPKQWSGISIKSRNELILDWIDGVRNRFGQRTPFIIYMSSYFADDVLGCDARLNRHLLWLAHYTTAPRPRVPRPWKDYTFWQFTNKGQISGIESSVDLNRFNGDLSDLKSILIS